MGQAAESSRLIRFESFEVNVRSGELRRSGERVRLPEQSFQILAMLLQRPGEVVMREEIQKRLWPNDTVVEFENSINAAVKRLRLALGDSADEPRYVETLARRGYRWMVPVEWVDSSAEARHDAVHAAAPPAEPSASNLTGKKVSHYRVLEILGGGGMGVVYKAEDIKLGRRVALKFLPEELSHDAQAMQRLEREARAASTLNHPNICTIYEVEEEDGQLFIVMELLQGQTLRELIEAPGSDPLPVPKVLDLAKQMVAALDAAHSHGIIHRDIKPANIHVTAQGQAKILDFGLAKLQGAETSNVHSSPPTGPQPQDLSLSRSGEAMGTAGYMSPEQVRGEKLDARTDIYSFGLVLYEMATGRRAFMGDNISKLHVAILEQEPVPARKLNPRIPEALDTVIITAMQKDREARYPSASRMLEALQAVEVGGAPVPALAPQAVVFEKKRRRPGKFWVALVAVVVAIALGAAAVAYYVRQRQALRLTDQDTIVLADFSNSTGDAIFDDTLQLGLTTSLRQSPFLDIVPSGTVRRTLTSMTLPPDTPLTTEVARDVCRRAHSKAYVSGAIASLGSEYVLGLKAVDCQSGETLASEQVTAASRDKVLEALSQAATKLRVELGESLLTVGKFDLPLNQTTSSLEALKEYNLAMNSINQGPAAMLAHDLRAIQIDPNFAMVYLSAAGDYLEMNQRSRAAEYLTRAFQLRDHADELEALQIAGTYYSEVTGELDKAEQAFQKVVASYPRCRQAYGNLSGVYAKQGRYDKSLKVSRDVFRLSANPSWEVYVGLALDQLSLQLFQDARQTLQTALDRKLDTDAIHQALYGLAFVAGERKGVKEQSAWFASQPEYQPLGLSLDSDSEAYSGRLGRARILTQKAVDGAAKNDDKEAAALWLSGSALREAMFDNPAQARQAAAQALKMAPDSQGVDLQAALAFALAGDQVHAQSLRQELDKRFPLDTQVQSLWLATIDAQMELADKKPAAAIVRLQAAAPVELGNITFTNAVSCLYPVYVRGEAYLASGQGNTAAGEFQKILDHSGIVWNCPTGALARLGLARANALESRTDQGVAADAARARALSAYRDFFALWKDADPDIPILKQAKAEYAKLQ